MNGQIRNSDEQSPLKMDIELRLVTREDEVERLVEINHDAMMTDPLFHWKALYTDQTEDESTKAALFSAIDDPTNHIVKAVARSPDTPGDEVVVGFVHWFHGYIELPKEDHDEHAPIQDTLVSESKDDKARAARLAIGDAMYVDSRNFYISVIRWQKHQCECMGC